MTGTNFEFDDDTPLPSQSHPPLATALFGGIGTVILGVLAVVAVFGYGVFKVIQKKLSGSKIRPPLDGNSHVGGLFIAVCNLFFHR